LNRLPSVQATILAICTHAFASIESRYQKNNSKKSIRIKRYWSKNKISDDLMPCSQTLTRQA